MNSFLGVFEGGRKGLAGVDQNAAVRAKKHSGGTTDQEHAAGAKMSPNRHQNVEINVIHSKMSVL